MVQELMILQVIIAILLIVVVLLQFGKGAEAGLFTGGGASDGIFTGAQRGNILSKITVVLSILFLGGSIFLARLQASKTEESIMSDEAPLAVPLSSDVKDAKSKETADPSSPATSP